MTQLQRSNAPVFLSPAQGRLHYTSRQRDNGESKSQGKKRVNAKETILVSFMLTTPSIITMGDGKPRVANVLCWAPAHRSRPHSHRTLESRTHFYLVTQDYSSEAPTGSGFPLKCPPAQSVSPPQFLPSIF